MHKLLLALAVASLASAAVGRDAAAFANTSRSVIGAAQPQGGAAPVVAVASGKTAEKKARPKATKKPRKGSRAEAAPAEAPASSPK